MEGETAAIKRHGGDLCVLAHGQIETGRRGGAGHWRHGRLPRMGGLIDNGGEHEGKAAHEQHPHHDHGDLEQTHLTRGEHRPWQGRVASLTRRPFHGLMSSHLEHIDIEAGESHRDMRLDRLLSASLPALSRTRLQALIKQGQVTSGGATIEDPKYRVKPGERFRLIVPPPAPAVPEGQAIPLNIVYEDDALIVIDKPAGLVVHPGAGHADQTLVNALIAHCGKSLSGIGGVARPGIIHRLDKDTSGLLVVAKTDQAHRSLAAEFADHGRAGSLTRAYLALVWGAPPRPHGTINAPIGRHPTSRTKMAVVGEGKGRPAVTHYRVLASFGRDPAKGGPIASLLECRLETGRTHQVRVHLAHLGVPVIGDPLYAQGFKTKIGRLPEPLRGQLSDLHRQALHAARLGFVHPVTGTLLEFNSELPPDLARIVESFKEL
jgi:23S rRNA pseudouridine1911/1915/1917 synthase